MIALIKPTKIAIYLNPDGKTMKAVKDETGCDYIINGGLFEGLTKPCPLLKKDGYWYTTRPWNAWGMAWNNADDCALLNVSDTRQNFISCVDLVNPWTGATGKLSYPPDMGGARQRTAWGITEDGQHLLYVDQSGHTPEQLRDELTASYKFKSLLMLDGGGSTQGIFKDKALTASRQVANFICFWTDDKDINVPTKKEESTTAILRKGDKGEAVRQLQANLNTCGASITVDGDFGANTYNAVKRFQSAYGITADGVCGTATQNAINAVKTLKVMRDTDADKLVSKALEYLGRAEPDGDDYFISAYNKVTGSGFGLTVSWCQIFVWFCLSYFNFDAPETASCTAARKYWKERGKWREVKAYTPEKGNIIYYDFDGSGDCDHVGIVISVDEQYITTIEGNTSTSIGDAVAIKRHDKGATYITGYADALAESKTASKSKDYIVKFSKENAETLAKIYNGEVVKA